MKGYVAIRFALWNGDEESSSAMGEPGTGGEDADVGESGEVAIWFHPSRLRRARHGLDELDGPLSEPDFDEDGG